MSIENLNAFEQKLREDSELQAELQSALDAFEGDRCDERAIFDATIGKIAAGIGLPFSFDDVVESRSSSMELSDDELDAVAGGGGFCFIIGVSSDVEDECGRDEGHACAYVGVGIIDMTR